MVSIQNINTVARYETKTLFRSWFFRIFAGISVLLLIAINLGQHANPQYASWNNRALSAMIPYFNISLLNTVQAIIAIFLASDFMKRDKKLDTTEVIYVRPMSNFEYVFGKTAGILGVFLMLNVVVMLISAIFQISLSDVDFNIKPLLLYPLLISIPTLVYILGLAFLLMVILKNQAITFLVLLGYVALTVFVIGKSHHNLFDYMAYNLPMMYSDIVGFGNETTLFMHRGIYFLAGLAFISITFSTINRLPQAGAWSHLGYVIGALLLIGSGFLTYSYLHNIYTQKDQRAAFYAANNRFAHLPQMDVTDLKLDIAHKGAQLAVVSDITIKNSNRQMVDTFVFSLNPALKVSAVLLNNKPVNFNRIQHVIEVTPDKQLFPRQSANLQITYSGKIDESIAYLDIDSTKLQERRWLNLANIDKRYAFLTPDYTLLTPEVLWYPATGVTYNSHNNTSLQADFFNFEINISGLKKQTPYSQGVTTKTENGYTIKSEHPYNQLSLTIGNYQEKSIVVDEVTYKLAYLKGHDFFSNYFDLMSDTLPDIIKATKDDYEKNIDLYYPFKKLVLLEVPIQFQSYKHILGGTYATVQPEIILLPEKGMGLRGADFARSKYREERRNRRNETVLPIETQTNLFRRFIFSTFFAGMTRTSGMMRGGTGDMNFSIDFGGSDASENPYAIFPQYYNYMVAFADSKIPAFNTIIEAYLKEGFSVSGFRQMAGGMSDVERANLAIQKETLTDLINSNSNQELVDNVIYQKGHYLVSLLKKRIGALNFDNFLYYFIEDYRYNVLTVDDFINKMRREYDYDCRELLESWDSFNAVPGYLISQPVYYELKDGVGMVYVVKFKVTNTEDANGILNASIRSGGGGGRFGGSNSEGEERIYEIGPNETKDISILLYDAPRMVTLSTVISKNIPASLSYFMRDTETNGKYLTPEEFEKVVETPVSYTQPGEIVVDNESDDFNIVSNITESPVKKYIDSFKTVVEEDNYGSIRRRNAPRTWQAITHSSLYGEHIRSAYYVRGGSGDQMAQWRTAIPEKGFYDLYAYIPTGAMVNFRRRGRPGQGGGPSFSEDGKTYNYTLFQHNEPEEIAFKMNNVTDGWNMIGSYYIDSDTVMLQLTNQSDAGKVMADAIKFVKRIK